MAKVKHGVNEIGRKLVAGGGLDGQETEQMGLRLVSFWWISLHLVDVWLLGDYRSMTRVALFGGRVRVFNGWVYGVVGFLGSWLGGRMARFG
ncbi:hypothetical protein LWI28_027281 [Acer negundo]|uniref:Uncharacterized protein n=1 Tax=Acer negundo TaxID=4023 RepID=A0AAD5JC00_ACENE|nr:hypothetical protein LWI28_027281 [Acer negundo]